MTVNLLVFSTLFPNAAQPHHGIFVENRLRHLLKDSGYGATIVAPVPWFPSKNPRFGSYAEYAQVKPYENRHGLDVWHPRYLVLPKIGMTITPFSMYLAARRRVKALLSKGKRFDLIDAHYFYPDGVAAGLIAREFGLPYVITGRGTDLNLVPRYFLPRKMIKWTAKQASGLITVCDALADDLASLGIKRECVTVLRNGVDLSMFYPDEPGGYAVRDQIGWQGNRDAQPRLIASVGHLIERKGHDLVISALCDMPDTHLVIAGIGPEENRLRRLVKHLNLGERVHFLGLVPHERLRTVYSAADVLVLASSREGWPNVLLESMACGTPVVATAVNGSPEVVQSDVAGRIVKERSAKALAAAATELLAKRHPISAVWAYAERFSWDETSRGQMDLFQKIMRNAAPCQSAQA